MTDEIWDLSGVDHGTKLLATVEPRIELGLRGCVLSTASCGQKRGMT